jgi:hypothetical protein
MRLTIVTYKTHHMKKIASTLFFALIYSFSYSQGNGHHGNNNDDHWNIFGNNIDSLDVLGSTNNFPINFIVNSIQKMKLDVNGNLKLNNLAGTGNRVLLTDPYGLISALPQGSSGQFLQSNGTWGNLPSSATVWSVSGSKLSLSPGTLLGIGTTPAYPLDVAGSAHITNDLIVDGGIVLTDINKTASGLQLNIGGSAAITGNLRIASLGGSSGSVLSVDNLGNVLRGMPVISCVPGSPQWSISGDNFFPYSTTMGNFSEASIGTCNSYDFILKANAINRVWIKTDGKIGFGTASPTQQFEFVGGNMGIGTGPFLSLNKMLTVNGDVCFANYASTGGHPNDGFSAFEIVGDDKIPGRRGISLENDPNGDLNFFINGNQSTGSPTFKFKNGFTTATSASNAPDILTINAQGVTNITGYMPTNSSSSPLTIINNNLTGNQTLFQVQANGGTVVGDNYVPLGYMLAVKGKIIAEEVVVELRGNWPDYVFNKDYKLMALNDLERFINKNNHLPNIPSSKEIAKDGAPLGDIVKKQMEKIEEMTLYIINQQKQIDELKSNIETLNKK